MDDALRERVETLERAVTDGDHDLSAFADEAEAVDRLDTLESRVDAFEDRIEELEAATQALRGYVGNVRSVNADIEQRADAALAKVESLEATFSESPDHEPATTADNALGEHHDGSCSDPGQEPGSVPDTSDADSAAEPQAGPGSEQGTSAGQRPGIEQRTAPEAVRHGEGSEPPERGHRRGQESSSLSRTARAGDETATAEHCSSCGRPHEAEARDSDQPAGGEPNPAAPQGGQTVPGGASNPTTPGEQPTKTAHPTPAEQPTAAQQSRQVERPAASTQPEHTERTTVESSQAQRASGAPTVESLAAGEQARGLSETPTAAGEDDALVPDGDSDPLVGATDGDGEAGTLQRIRDLL